MFKLTPSQIRDFESDQKQHGTRVALGNLFWRLGAEFMKTAGVTKIKTQYGKAAGKERRKAA